MNVDRIAARALADEANAEARLATTIANAVTLALVAALTKPESTPAPVSPKAAPVAGEAREWVSKPCNRLVILRTGKAPRGHQMQAETVAFYKWARSKGAKSVKAAKALYPAYKAGAR